MPIESILVPFQKTEPYSRLIEFFAACRISPKAGTPLLAGISRTFSANLSISGLLLATSFIRFAKIEPKLQFWVVGWL